MANQTATAKKTIAKKGKKAASAENKKKGTKKLAASAKRPASASDKSRQVSRTGAKSARKSKVRPSGGAKRGQVRVRKRRALGRPKVTADAVLDHLFQKDYQAREVFHFLRVETIRELEAFSPDEILERMAGPLMQTLQRIRKAMAMANRCLKGDKSFALEFLAALDAATP